MIKRTTVPCCAALCCAMLRCVLFYVVSMVWRERRSDVFVRPANAVGAATSSCWSSSLIEHIRQKASSNNLIQSSASQQAQCHSIQSGVQSGTQLHASIDFKLITLLQCIIIIIITTLLYCI